MDETLARYSSELGRRMYSRVVTVILAVGSFGYFSYWSDCTVFLVIEPQSGVSEVMIDRKPAQGYVQTIPWGRHTITWEQDGVPRAAEFTNEAGDNYLYLTRIPPYLSAKGKIKVLSVQ